MKCARPSGGGSTFRGNRCQTLNSREADKDKARDYLCKSFILFIRTRVTIRKRFASSPAIHRLSPAPIHHFLRRAAGQHGVRAWAMPLPAERGCELSEGAMRNVAAFGFLALTCGTTA